MNIITKAIKAFNKSCNKADVDLKETLLLAEYEIEKVKSVVKQGLRFFKKKKFNRMRKRR